MELKKVSDPKEIAVLNENVQTIHSRMYPEVFKPYDFKAVYDYFSHVINKENHHFLVGEEEGVPIGYIWFEEVRRSETAFSFSRDYVYIHQISVNSDFQGRGVGKCLLTAVKEFARERGIERVGLDYWTGNVRSKEIYEKMGFEVEKEIAYLTL